jgi:diguanylate cyclase (GGDEF)-like protein
VARAAIAGLALGLVALATLTAWGTVESRTTTERVRRVNRISTVWGSLFSRVSAEDSATRIYLTSNGARSRRAPLVSALRSAEPDLSWLARNGGEIEARHAREVQTEYHGFTAVVQEVLLIADPERMASYAELEAQYFASLREHIVDNMDRVRLELAVYLVRVDHRNLVLRWVGVGVVVVDLLLCLLSSIVLVGYQRRAEREVAISRYKARHDHLTGLPNRQLLAERAEQAVAEARRTNQLVGLLLVDLDRFKDVNDTLGHHAGDLLLRMVGARILEVARGSDTVARLGGDEFAVLLPAVASVDDLSVVADRLRRTIQEPMAVGGLTVDLGASIGAAAFPIDCANEEDLLRHADVAMYVAKRGGFGVRRYTPGSDAADPSALSVLSELRRGIDRGELVLFYQPKVEANSLRMSGVEALVRWQHPDRGLLPPGMFLPVIEPTEFIEELTEAVLRMAIDQAAGGRRRPAARGVGEHHGQVAAGRRLPGPGGRDAHRVRRPAGAAHARTHRDRADHRAGRRLGGPAPAAVPGGQGVDRRLRHRVLVDGVPAGHAGPGTEDRPELRHDHADRRAQPRHRQRHGGPREKPDPRRGGRGRRGRGDAAVAGRPRLPPDPGLPHQPTAAGL